MGGMFGPMNKIASAFVILIGLLHLGVGRAAFVTPTERGVWFVSAGFLLVTTGLANMASSTGSSKLQIAAAASGSLAILILGVLIASASPELLLAPQTIVLLGLGSVLSGLRLRDLLLPSR